MLRNRYARAFAGLAVVGLLVSCSKERPLEPVPVSYRLYVAMNPSQPNEDRHILIIECEADSVIDSLFLSEWGEQPWEGLSATPQPGIIIVATGQVDKVLDTRSGKVIASLEQRFRWLAHFPELGRIVGTNTLRTEVIEDTNYTTRKVWEREFSGCRRIGNSSRAIGRSRFNKTGGAPYGPFLIYDVANDRIVDSFLIDPLQDGLGFAFYPDFEISPDGEQVYGYGEDASGTWLLGYDLPQKKVLFKRPPLGLSSYEFCFVTPDAREVWTVESVNPFGYPWSQSIKILDAFSGALLDTIDLSGPALGLGEVRVTAPNQIQFVPAQSKAYVSVWTDFFGLQPLIVIATDTRTISKVLFQDGGSRLSSIALGPWP